MEDYWPIPIMGGFLQPIQEGEQITAFEFSIANQDYTYAPNIEESGQTQVSAQITTRDKLFPFVRQQLEEAFAYLQCYFNVELVSEEIEAKYVGETEEEEEKILIKSYKTEKAPQNPIVPYDMFTRSLMAAERTPAPRFEATFVLMARAEMSHGRFIDSFRYSFLLIESVYGEGKIKSKQLKDSLKTNSEFSNIVAMALEERIQPRTKQGTDTEKILSGGAGVDDVIDHIVDKRGYYFHGNRKHRNLWQPHEQQTAESLCLFCLQIANLVAVNAAQPIFEKSLGTRHFEDAKSVGAIMTMQINYRFRERGETFDRDGILNVNIPGTKVTPKLAVHIASHFLKDFEERLPTANLGQATRKVEETGQRVFDLHIHA